MAYYAKLGLNSKVLGLYKIDNESITNDSGDEVEQLGIDILTKMTEYPFWVQTSYTNSIRKNYAGIGYRYDDELDAFIPPKPFTSWILDEETCQWEAPTPYPGDEDTEYMWDEEVQDWAILEEQETN